MTQKDILTREIEEYTLKTGKYIPTYRMSQFIAAADKVVNVILKTFPGISYYEMRIILKIVDGAIRESSDGGATDL